MNFECDRVIGPPGSGGDVNPWRRLTSAFRSHFHRRRTGEPGAGNEGIGTRTDLGRRHSRNTFRADPCGNRARRDCRTARKDVTDNAVAVVQSVVVVARYLGVNGRDVGAGLLLVAVADRKRSLKADLQQREGEREDSKSSRPPARACASCRHPQPHARRAARRFRATPSDTIPASETHSRAVVRRGHPRSPSRMGVGNRIPPR